MPQDRQHRVFFALWPDDQVARQFDAAGSKAHGLLMGRRMRRETLHLTLAFIGGIAPERLATLRDIAGTIRLPSFNVLFDRLQCRPRKKIVWASAGTVPVGLQELAATLDGQLRIAGFRTEARPFAVHVTLLRNANCATGAADDSLYIEWPVRDFVLVESELKPEGASYRIVGRWPLGQT